VGVTFDRLWSAALRPGDFHEHVGTLRSFAAQCETVTEFGVRHGASTAAILAARPRGGVHAYDWCREPGALEAKAQLEAAALELGLPFEFHVADTLTCPVIDPTDLLFIDTAHNATQLERELARHGRQARRFLAFHDTYTFGSVGDGYTEGCTRGLLVAIHAWLAARPEWRCVYHTDRCHGFTVLERNISWG